MVQDFKGRIKDITLLEDKPGIISKNLKIKSYQLRDLKQRILYKNWEGFNK